MATRTWLGGTDGNWGTAANWSASTVPADGDDVVINVGTVDITSGLDQSAVSLKSLLITKGFQASIGTAGTSLKVNVNYSGASTLRYGSDRGYLYIAPTSALVFYIDQASGGSGVSITGGTLSHATSIACGLSGAVKIGSGATVTGATTCGIGLTIETALAGTVNLYGGNHTSIANLGTFVLGAGATLVTKLATAITTGTLHGKATHIHDSSGIIATLNALPGSIHRPGGSKDYHISQLNRFAGSSVTQRTETAFVTIDAESAFGIKGS